MSKTNCFVLGMLTNAAIVSAVKGDPWPVALMLFGMLAIVAAELWMAHHKGGDAR